MGVAVLLATASAMTMSSPAASAAVGLDAKALAQVAGPTGTTAQTLVVTRIGPGSVKSQPHGIKCGRKCGASFADGAVVTLTPKVKSGSTFLGWSGDCTGVGLCQVTMNSAKFVTATFGRNSTLTVSTSGGGTVTSSPAGITCGTGGGDCTESYATGTVVSLFATPDAGFTFAGWNQSCSGAGTCSVTMDGPISVGAVFTPSNFNLQVALDGVIGAGRVTSNPAGINCGADCSETYASGTVVTLTPIVGGGFKFYGWSGACSGTGSCVITMDSNKSVTADFDCTPQRCKASDNATDSSDPRLARLARLAG